MRSLLRFRPFICALLLPAIFTLPIRAQHVPFAHLDGQILPIEAVRGGVPYVKIDGRPCAATGGGVILQPAPFYRDSIVRLKDFKYRFMALKSPKDVTNTPLQRSGTGNINCSITLSGLLTASQSLDSCFLVFELPASEDQPAELGTAELPSLVADKETPFHLSMTFSQIPKKKDYKFYIFTGRGECPIAKGRHSLDQDVQTEAEYLGQTANAAPATILRILPQYPPKLRTGNAPGHVNIRCRVGPNGDVRDLAVLDATQPEFGEAAAAAVKQWFFRPAVRDHHFVETMVEIPLAFHAPNPGI